MLDPRDPREQAYPLRNNPKTNAAKVKHVGHNTTMGALKPEEMDRHVLSPSPVKKNAKKTDGTFHLPHRQTSHEKKESTHKNAEFSFWEAFYVSTEQTIQSPSQETPSHAEPLDFFANRPPVENTLDPKEANTFHQLLFPLETENKVSPVALQQGKFEDLPLSSVSQDVQEALDRFLSSEEATSLDGQFILQQHESITKNAQQVSAAQTAVVSFHLTRAESGHLRVMLKKETALQTEYQEIDLSVKQAKGNLGSLLANQLGDVKTELDDLRQQAADLLIQNLYSLEQQTASFFLSSPLDEEEIPTKDQWWQDHPLRQVGESLKHLPIAAGIQRWRNVLTSYTLDGVKTFLDGAEGKQRSLENLHIQTRVAITVPSAQTISQQQSLFGSLLSLSGGPHQSKGASQNEPEGEVEEEEAVEAPGGAATLET